MKIAAMILAAGSSSRLGQPKQLLFFQGKTLLKSACEAAKASGCSPVVVVTGKEHGSLMPEILEESLVFHHKNWQAGLGSTIAAGISFLQKTDVKISAALILVCDQPYVDTKLLRKLIAKKKIEKKGIVASRYAGTLGVPVIFDRKYFDVLMHLSGETGAKRILVNHSNDISAVNFPKGAIDLDDGDDYENLKKSNPNRSFDQ